MKHNDTHYFEIGNDTLWCKYDDEYKKQGYWYAPANMSESLVFNWDYERGFKTKKGCEKYMKEQIKKYCIQTLKALNENL